MSTNAVEKILLEIATLSSTEQDAIKQALAYRTGSNGTVSENASAGINVSHSSDPVLSLKWVNDHASEFAGQYVALEGDRLIAHGANADPVIETVRAAGVKAPFFTYIPSSDALPVIGANLEYHVH
jgi:hypothetical protein